MLFEELCEEGAFCLTGLPLASLIMFDVTPFSGPVLMRVGVCGHPAAPSLPASRGVCPWRAECGLNVLYPSAIDQPGVGSWDLWRTARC